MAYTFSVRTDLITKPGRVVVAPATGRIEPNEKKRIAVRMKPGVPDAVLEKLVIEVL